MINENIYLQKNKKIKQKNLDDGCVLLNKEKDEIYTLNLTASYIWEMCDGSHSVGQIIDDLTDICNLKKDNIENEVHSIINDFIEKELIYKID